MRHVLLTGDAVGGVWRYSIDLARGLLARGVAVTFAVLGPAPSLAQAAEAAGVEVLTTGLPLDWMTPDAEELRASAACLAGLAGRLRVDAAHLHSPALAAHAPWPVAVVAVVHSDVGTWWRATHGGRLPSDLAWQAEAVAHGLAEADAVIAPSHAFARAVEAAYRPERRIDVVANGSVSPLATGARRARAALTAGRLWDAGKNVALLDRVAGRLDAPLLAAGPVTGPHGETVDPAHLRRLGMLGTEAVARHMAECAVYVSAARYEPFGLAVLEAARAGMALALSDIPTHRELWEGAALFFHPEDAGAALDAVRRLLRAPEAGAHAAVTRAACFGVDAMVEGTLAIHRALHLQAA